MKKTDATRETLSNETNYARRSRGAVLSRNTGLPLRCPATCHGTVPGKASTTAGTSPFGNHTWWADSERAADEGWGGDLNVGKNLNKWWNLKFSAQYEQLDINNKLGPFNRPPRNTSKLL